MKQLREAVRQTDTTNLSNRKIAQLTGYSHTTISKFRKILLQLDMGWPELEQLNDSELVRLFRTTRKHARIKRIPDWNFIHSEMQHPKITLYGVWEEYCMADKYSAYSFSWFSYHYARFVSKLDLSMRQTHKAGETVFVDFAGTTVPFFDLDTEENRQAQIFVGALGCSKFTFACAVRSQSLPDWIEAHNKMFQYFGGTPEVIVPDNLKSAVTKAGKSPVINRIYLEQCKFYGPIIVPARVRHPKDKALAEVSVQIVTRWILIKLRKHKFFSIEEINRAIAELLWELNERPFKRLPGCRRSRFEELDKPLLRPLPGAPFEYAEWTGKQKVSNDYHIRVKDHYYSVPHQIVGSKVEARFTGNTVEIFHLGKRVASHVRSYKIGAHTTLPEHQPVSHRLFANQTPEKMLEWAQSIGEAATVMVNNQFPTGKSPIPGLRACETLKRLATEYGDQRFEAACKRAELIGSLTVKSVRSILKRCLAELSKEDIPVQINLPLHQNVRGSNYYSNRSV